MRFPACVVEQRLWRFFLDTVFSCDSKVKSRPDEISRKDTVPHSRYIPSEVRERVHERANYQCEFLAADQTRCTARTGLEIEHKRPFAIYRSHEERFLKVLCRRHNRFKAEQIYGTEFIRAKIDERCRTGPARVQGG